MTLRGSKSSTPSFDRFNLRNSVSLVAWRSLFSVFCNNLTNKNIITQFRYQKTLYPSQADNILLTNPASPTISIHLLFSKQKPTKICDISYITANQNIIIFTCNKLKLNKTIMKQWISKLMRKIMIKQKVTAFK